MLCYIAVTWNEASRMDAENARRLLQEFRTRNPDWLSGADCNGLAVCYRNTPGPAINRAYALGPEQGVVLGRLFERRLVDQVDSTGVEKASQVQLDLTGANRIAASNGKDLLDLYWGQYVAFVREPLSGTVSVLRDPSGGVPCHSTRMGGVTVYFSRLQDCERFAPVSFSINSHYLLGYLMYDSACVRETGLNEVEAVLPGELVSHSSDGIARSFVWNPLEIAERDVIEDASEAVRLTNRVVRRCVRAWGSCFDGVLVRLSGGLDSSIVLSCLADAPAAPRLICLNEYSTGASSSDERFYARRAAEMAKCKLMEEERNPNYDLEHARSLPRAATPFPITHSPHQVREKLELMQSLGVSGVFDGNGGDEIFFRGGILPNSVDYASRHGVLRAQLLSCALDDASLYRKSFWKVLQEDFQYGVMRKPWHIRNLISDLHRPTMRAEAKQTALSDRQLWHDLYRDAPRRSPAKFFHAYLLTFQTARGHNPMTPHGFPVQISPLISQPLMELSLRIPLYIHTIGGRDRSIARRAFTGSVPVEIITRNTKGSPGESMRAILDRNMSFLRELLLDGFLVNEGYVDRKLLDQTLSRGIGTIRSPDLDILDYVNVEAWAQNWWRAPRRAAA